MFNVHGQVSCHLLNNSELLRILFSKKCHVRCNYIEKLIYYRTYASEVSRSCLSAQLARHLRLYLYIGSKSFRIHLLNTRMEHKITAGIFKYPAVTLEITRIACKILILRKLCRIKEYRSNRILTSLCRFLYKARMSGMQISHSRTKPYGMPHHLLLFNILSYFIYCLCDDHSKFLRFDISRHCGAISYIIIQYARRHIKSYDNTLIRFLK